MAKRYGMPEDSISRVRNMINAFREINMRRQLWRLREEQRANDAARGGTNRSHRFLTKSAGR